ncbi:MAG: lipid-A-disaccharide synthase [Bacteroidaceae bacterium]|nr:lipid-A-disaccharide synthase [Bacteroidaceae bacterium]
MKYYLIAGEASGDLHASHLIAALKAEDPAAQFRGFGGDLMQQQGLELVRHYRDLAYMGLVAVVMHLRTILRGMKQCREDIAAWRPDVVILVDYPGFNLKMARYVHDHALCPVYYYIAPKLWAWKEWRIKDIRRNVDEIFSILPFEVAFFEGKHHFPIHYVGNPTVDEVENYKCIVHSAGVHSAGVHSAGVHSAGVHSAGVHSAEVHSDTFAENNPESQQSLCTMHSSTMHSKHYIALLSGSRTHEIRDNLPRMIAAAEPFMKDYRLIVAGAPSIPLEHYQKYIGNHPVEVVYGRTYDLLSRATAALVTSGTATLETALFRVPQVVCYFMQFRQIASFLRRLLIKVKYISLVNLIADREVVPELVADHMTVKACRRHLASILPGGEARQAQLRGYEEVARRLGDPGAPHRAALQILQCLQTAKPVKTNMQTS